jgi:isopropylmalate/homocitrate/citramalate synthase
MRKPKESLDTLYVHPHKYTANNQFPHPNIIKIYDTTLRDGEQMPGVAMSPEQKYLIAVELSAIGCHILDLGFPASAPSERTTLQMVLQGKYKGDIREDVEILVMCRATEHDIDATIEALDAQGLSPKDVTVLIFTASSYLHCKYKLGATLRKREGVRENENAPLEFYHEANKRMVSDVIRYARSRGIENIEFGAEDASRTPLPQLIDLISAADVAGIKRYVFADTTGSLSPEATKIYCSELSRVFPGLERATHFHNDFDLATTNVITGLLNGFSVFSTTVNGIGERAGNAALHSVLACLKYVYGIELPNFQYDRLWRLKSIVEGITGVPVAAQEPIVGYNVYTHESGIHAHGVDVIRCMYEPLPFEDVGGISRNVYGKHSGAHTIEHMLNQHQCEFDCPVDQEFVQLVVKEVKSVRELRTLDNRTSTQISDYYRNLESLGISDTHLLQLAKRISRARAIKVAKATA